MVQPVQQMTPREPPPRTKINEHTQPGFVVPMSVDREVAYYVVDFSHNYNAQPLMSFAYFPTKEKAMGWAMSYAPILKRSLRVVSPPAERGFHIRMVFGEVHYGTHEFKTGKPQSPGWGEF